MPKPHQTSWLSTVYWNNTSFSTISKLDKQLPHGTSISPNPLYKQTTRSEGLDCFDPVEKYKSNCSRFPIFKVSIPRTWGHSPCDLVLNVAHACTLKYVDTSSNHKCTKDNISIYINQYTIINIDMIYMYIYICAEVDHIPRHPVRRIYIARKVWHRHRHHQRGLFPNPGMSSVTRLSWRSIFPCTNLTQWSNTVDDSDMTSIIIKLSKPEKNLNVHKQSPHGGVWKTLRTFEIHLG